MGSRSKGLHVADGSIAVVSVFREHLVALDLSTGQILWTQKTSGRPVAVTARHVVVVEATPRPHLVVHDIRTGDTTVQTEGTEFPGNANGAFEQTDAQVFQAEEEGESLIVNWASQDLYHGGAAPQSMPGPPSIQAGRVALNTATGTYQAEARAAPTDLAALEGLGDEAAMDVDRLPGELERQRVRDTDYVLRVETTAAAEQIAILTALRPMTGAIDWETEIGRSQASLQPAPLRK